MSVKTVMDRIFAINQKVTVTNSADEAVNIRTYRTYPTKFDPSTVPLITAVPGTGTFLKNYGNADDYTLVTESMNVEIIVRTTDYFADADKGVAQLLAEKLMDSVKQVYWARPRLELNGGDELDCLTEEALLGNRANFVPVPSNQLEIVFNLSVKFETKIARVTP